MRPIVITGFEPYGGRSINPAHEIMRAMNGKTIDGAKVIGCSLPVSIRALTVEIAKILDELQPAAVISFGLSPGEPMIRLERVGINIADFEIPDNEGIVLEDVILSSNGAEARFSTLPLRHIERAMLEAGIPARITATAGTFLCNACLYHFLEAAEGRFPATACGFVHVPYLPEQVALALACRKDKAVASSDRPYELPCMDLSMGIRAAEIAASETLRIQTSRAS